MYRPYERFADDQGSSRLAGALFNSTSSYGRTSCGGPHDSLLRGASASPSRHAVRDFRHRCSRHRRTRHRDGHCGYGLGAG